MMLVLRWIAAFGMVWLVTVPALATPQGKPQAPTQNLLLFDESGRQLESRPPGKPAASAAAKRPMQTQAVPGTKLAFETETKIKSNKLPDGQEIPRLESYRHATPPQFLGMSLSVPTNWLKPRQ